MSEDRSTSIGPALGAIHVETHQPTNESARCAVDEWKQREWPRLAAAMKLATEMDYKGWFESAQGKSFEAEVIRAKDEAGFDIEDYSELGLVFLAGALWHKAGGSIEIVEPEVADYHRRWAEALYTLEDVKTMIGMRVWMSGISSDVAPAHISAVRDGLELPNAELLSSLGLEAYKDGYRSKRASYEGGMEWMLEVRDALG